MIQLNLLVVVIICTIFSNPCATQTPDFYFTSTPVNLTKQNGEEVLSIECGIRFPADGTLKVEWWNLKDNFQLSSDMFVLANESKYTISFRPLTFSHTAEHDFTLTIRNLTIGDSGVYACRGSLAYSTRKIQQTHILTVAGELFTTPSPAVLPHVNFSDCCTKEGVSDACLPLCATDTLDLALFSTCSSDDTQTILTCGGDGRNHAQCCNIRGVNASCLDLCMLSQNEPQSTQQSCASQFVDVYACFQVGQAILPDPPTELSATPISTTAIFVSWEKPIENAEIVIAYRLFYHVYDDTKGFHSTDRLSDPNNTTYTIHGLDADTTYTIKVAAYNTHGGSIPSYSVDATTIEESDSSGARDVTVCCRNAGINDECTNLLCNSSSSLSTSDALKCFPDISLALACYSEDTNFSQCCTLKGIPSSCSSLCGGTNIPLGYDQLGCILYLPHARPCLQHSDKLPGPPRNVRIGAITSHSVHVLWDPPLVKPENVTATKIIFDSVPSFRMPETIYVYQGATEIAIDDLYPGDTYWLQLRSITASIYDSPYSSRLYFTTYKNGQSDSWVVPTGPLTTSAPEGPHNETAVIPRPPQNFHITGRDSSSIGLGWTRPSQIGIGIEAYLVEYRTKNEPATWNNKTTNQTDYTLKNLQSNRRYLVRVSSYNQNSSSLPSPTIEVSTLLIQGSTPRPPSSASGINNTECCRSQNVSAKGLVYCSGTVAVPGSECPLDDIPKILVCVSGGSNHTPCCLNSNVPDECLGMCRSQLNTTLIHEDVAKLLCLRFIPSVFSCVHANVAKLPPAPESFTASSGITYINLQWQPPSHNSENVIYKVFLYCTSTTKPYIYLNINQTSLNITDLHSATMYEVFVIAENAYGSSLPTATIFISTEQPVLPRIIRIHQNPVGVISEGHSVDLRCEVTGNPFPRVHWLDKNGNNVSETQDLNITQIQRQQSGRYTCVAENAGGKAMLDTAVWILHPPVVSLSRDPSVPVTPDMGLLVKLQCYFEGYVSHIWWTQNSIIIRDMERFQVTQGLNPGLGVMEAHLNIKNVQTADLTFYTCHGNNSLGYAHADITLHDHIEFPTIAPPPGGTLPSIPDVRACCESRNVQPECLQACTFDMDLSLIEPSNYYQCKDDMDEIVTCQADGKDHTQCCMNKYVPWECLDLCRGLVPKYAYVEGKYDCLGHLETIVDCMEEGHEIIPSAPVNVNATIYYSNNQDQGIRIFWGYPLKNSLAVESYQIFCEHNDTSSRPHIFTVTVDGSVHNYIVSPESLNIGYTYAVYIKSVNHFGTSQNSSKQFINYQVLPSAPLDLQLMVYENINIRITWKLPDRLGDSAIKYKLFYRRVTTDGELPFETEIIDNLTVTLKNLFPKTTYEVYVQAFNIYGSGGKTAKATANTPKAPDYVTNQGLPRTTSIALGVVITLIIIVIAVAAAAYYYVRIYLKKAKFKESVSFENPSYTANGDTGGRVRISGLPGDTTRSSSNQYEESSITQQQTDKNVYATISNGAIHGDNSKTDKIVVVVNDNDIQLDLSEKKTDCNESLG